MCAKKIFNKYPMDNSYENILINREKLNISL